MCWAVSTSVGNLASKFDRQSASRTGNYSQKCWKAFTDQGTSLSQSLSCSPELHFSHQEAEAAEERQCGLGGELPMTVQKVIVKRADLQRRSEFPSVPGD